MNMKDDNDTQTAADADSLYMPNPLSPTYSNPHSPLPPPSPRPSVTDLTSMLHQRHNSQLIHDTLTVPRGQAQHPSSPTPSNSSDVINDMLQYHHYYDTTQLEQSIHPTIVHVNYGMPSTDKPSVVLVPYLQSKHPKMSKSSSSTRTRNKLPFLEAFILWYNLYRQLYTLCVLVNLTAIILIATNQWEFGQQHVNAFTIGNIVISVVSRNELFLRLNYWLCVKLYGNMYTPVWWKCLVTNFLIHLGGIHSGCASGSLIWISYIVVNILDYSHLVNHWILISSTLSLGFISISMISAFPLIRYYLHNYFELFHRFAGWSSLAVTWVFVILSDTWSIEEQRYIVEWNRLYDKPELWMTIFLSLLIINPWLTIRKVAVEVTSPSPKVVLLKFAGGVRSGLLGRISRDPLLEWHAFGIISEGIKSENHYMCITPLGDFTRSLCDDPPKALWTRTLHFAGLPYLADMFQRGVCLATGAGIGVTLSVAIQGKTEWQLIWVGSDFERNYGEEFMSLVRRSVKHLILWDSKLYGRPPLLELVISAYKQFHADVVFVTSNPKGTREIVNGCQRQGIQCFGPIWDS